MEANPCLGTSKISYSFSFFFFTFFFFLCSFFFFLIGKPEQNILITKKVQPTTTRKYTRFPTFNVNETKK